MLGGDGTALELFSFFLLVLLCEVEDFWLTRRIFDLRLRRDTLDLLRETLDLGLLSRLDFDLLLPCETIDFDLSDATFDLLTLPRETGCLLFPSEIVDLDLDLLFSVDLTLRIRDDDLPWELVNFELPREDDDFPRELDDFDFWLPSDTFDLPRLLLVDLIVFPLELLLDVTLLEVFFFDIFKRFQIESGKSKVCQVLKTLSFIWKLLKVRILIYRSF